jgi:hypothetical protein
MDHQEQASVVSSTRHAIDEDWVLTQHQNQQTVNANILKALQDIQRQLNESIQQPVEGTIGINGGSDNGNRNNRNSTSNNGISNNGNASDNGKDPLGTRSDTASTRAKHSLTHPDKYDGENKTGYPAFKGHLRAKLRIDQKAIRGEPEQVWYGFGRLSGKAAERLYPWIESTESRGFPLRVSEFFNQLDSAFLDTQSAQRALEWINTRRQGKTPFREFLQQFEQKLLEAGGWDIPDSIRKGYLRAAINLEIRTQLVGRDEPIAYGDYVSLI